MPILSKKRPFSQKHCALMSIKKNLKSPCCHAHIWSKNVNCLKKKTALITFFSNFSWKTPSPVKPIFGPKNCQCFQKYAILWATKVKRIPFFPTFHEKLLLSCPYFVKKNVNFLKNTLISCPYFVEKTSKISKTQYSHVIFFRFVIKKPKLPCPYLVKKASILSKINYIMG